MANTTDERTVQGGGGRSDRTGDQGRADEDIRGGSDESIRGVDDEADEDTEDFDDTEDDEKDEDI